MCERGISPIIATVILIGLTGAAATPLAIYFAGMWAPVRPFRTDVQVFAGLVNENVIRLHIQHIGGRTVSDPLDPERGIYGTAASLVAPVDNLFYCWTFENPERFGQGDWGRAEVQLHGVNLRVGDQIDVHIWIMGRGVLYSGRIYVDDIRKIPG
jgi:flagellin-like protein